jgi:Flp pilus assembly pilin Flp
MMERLAAFAHDDTGADLIEYALLAAFVAGLGAVALTQLKDGITGFFAALVQAVDAE